MDVIVSEYILVFVAACHLRIRSERRSQAAAYCSPCSLVTTSGLARYLDIRKAALAPSVEAADTSAVP